jgi:Predicted phage phi-C31 gp36 major capsid-like protein
MSVQTVTPEIMGRVFSQLDVRYASQEAVQKALEAQVVVNQELTGAVRKQTEASDKLLQEIITMKQAPAFLREKRKDGKETSLAKLCFCLARWAKQRDWPTEKQYTAEVDYLKKALASATGAAGGLLLPEEWDTTIIEEMKALAVVFRAGPTVIPITAKKMHIPRFDADSTFQWLGENVASTESSAATGEVVLDLFTARGYAVGSVEFFREGGPAVDAAVQAQMTRALARFVDLGFLTGSGANRPTGMRSVAGINQTGAAGNGANGGALIYDDLSQTIFLADEDDVPQDGRVWFYHPRVGRVVRNLKDANNLPLFLDQRSQAEAPTLFGYPVFTSSQIPINEAKGTGTNLTTLQLVRMPSIYIGVGTGPQGVEIDISEHAEFKAAGIAIRAMARVDLQPAFATAIAICDGIQ